MTEMKPSVGRLVHYVSHGSPVRLDGTQAFTSTCRAAVITEVGQWVSVETNTPTSFDRSEGRPIRLVEQWWYDDALALTVLNPNGFFLNGAGPVACKHDENDHAGGTWHWPERV